MAFAGGPYNNYFFQATAKPAQLLKARAGPNALLSCVSGIMTKQAFALWSSERPEQGFVRIDVTDETAARSVEVEVETDFVGAGRVAGSTVIYSRGKEPFAVLLIDTERGTRALITGREEAVLRSVEEVEWIGREVRVVGGRLAP